MDYPDIDIAPLIDHALLNPTTTPEQVEKGCQQADRYGFAAVCIYPIYVKQAAELLHGRKPKVCTVIGFPTGLTTSATKLYEAQEAVENGATEIDFVINLGYLKAGKTEELYREIAEICEETNQTVKAILETNLLTDTEKRLAAEISMDAGVQFIKTSTGWHGGATVADVKLLKKITQGQIGIKASGGIRTIEQAFDLVIAGATRLGTSRGIDLLRQLENREEEN
ncbi:MAG TPA: deoxyribose-phosphate aldolase [Cyanobacteria bacterium UBA11159]|nr:deoxyribose-phosphate aldolase [Cyanobacteria bacterium UBA11367]HBE58804.1 deoxyribose-phosphate aldolase [Cyanobacteria bacterium UBA11366]HBK64392.1 deoxyribose-phosphate aldolase [Cyanobacteria bacterium UBA11166]HBR73418.1 deoxyribose-phosphate aldolase [Cyanobacteria bacterium UBA11159]HBS68114.1 deoxyribose-phosphate aldolase [Cyanobacteria bacterium UBA11153]HCA97358.1 deoxyribose-phosphate aldolase [Cyanobacteria bacterium UBA9226]